MEKVLQIKRKTFNKLNNYCSPELIKTLFDDLGVDNILIDEGNNCDDIWDVTSYIQQDSNLLEKAKLIRVFDYLLGKTIYKGRETQYSVLCRLLNKTEFDKVFLYWLHTKLNGEIPTLSLGDITIPELLPHFVPKELPSGNYIIERLLDGQWIEMDVEIYPTYELAKQRANELEDDYMCDIND